MARASEFSFVRGTVESATRMSQTHVSGGRDTGVSSHTEHWTEVRARLENDQIVDYNLIGKYSPGDKFAVLWWKKKRVGDTNLTTNKWWSNRRLHSIGARLFLWPIICFMLFFLFSFSMYLWTVNVLAGVAGFAFFGWLVFISFSSYRISTISRKMLMRIDQETRSVHELV